MNETTAITDLGVVKPSEAISPDVLWLSGTDLSTVYEQPVRFKFYVQAGQLLSFWVTDDRGGASYGYMAGGGPGFPKGRDLPINRIREN